MASLAGQLTVGQTKQHQGGVDIEHCLTDGHRQLCTFGGHVVKRAMRFDVGKLQPLTQGNAHQCAHLIDHHVVGLRRGDGHVAAAKALQVRQTGMRPGSVSTGWHCASVCRV